MNLNVDVFDGSERAELHGEILAADGDLAAEVLVAVMPRKRGVVHLVPEAAQCGDEGVFECRIVNVNVVDRKTCGVHALP